MYLFRSRMYTKTSEKKEIILHILLYECFKTSKLLVQKLQNLQNFKTSKLQTFKTSKLLSQFVSKLLPSPNLSLQATV